MIKRLVFDSGVTKSAGQRIAITMSTILKEAAKDGLIAFNPATGIATNVGYEREALNIPNLSYRDLVTVVDHIRPEWRLLIWLMYGAGMRPGEARGLHLDQVRNGFIRIDRQAVSKSDVVDNVRVRNIKKRKAGQYRDVPLPEWLEQKIAEHAAEFGITGDCFPDFTDPKGVWSVRFMREYKRGVKAIGHPTMIPYDLRHIYAATMLTNLMPIHELAKYMGHRDINITVNTYGFLMAGHLNRGHEISQDAFTRWESGEQSYRTK
jgi:integrase